MIEIKMIAKPNELTQKWAVYFYHDATTLHILHIGVVKLSQLFSLTDARMNKAIDFDEPAAIRVESLHENKAMAMRDALKLRSLHKIPILLNPHSTVIKDVETGETFNSARELAEMRGLSPSQLSNHLNRKPGFNTIKGKVYEKSV